MDANGQNQEGARKCVYCQTVEELESENRRLRKEQDVLFLLMDLGMTAVELWGEQHGLFSGKKDPDEDPSDGNNQIGMLFDKVRKAGKEAGADRLAAFFELLQGAK